MQTNTFKIILFSKLPKDQAVKMFADLKFEFCLLKSNKILPLTYWLSTKTAIPNRCAFWI